MPLFGHKNDNVVGTGNSSNLLRKNNHLQSAGADGTTHTGHHGHTGPGPAIGAAAGGAAGHHEGHTTTGALLGGLAGHHHAKNHPDAVHNSAGVNASGVTTNVHGTHAAGPGMDHGGSAKEKELIGKIEHAAGTILCSSTLKAKGIEKEREGQAQAAEIGAAQNLEQEAHRHRLRANELDGHGTGTGVTGGGNMTGVGAGGVYNATHPVGTSVHGGVPPAQDTFGTASGYPAGAPNDGYARGAPNAGVAGAGTQSLR